MDGGSSALATLKEATSLKLETPFFLVSSLAGLAVVAVPHTTPLHALTRFRAWIGWANGGAWVEPARAWLTASAHVDIVHFVCWVCATAGVALAAVGPRPPFFAWLGIAGLVETGATSDAWQWPLVAFVLTSVIGRLRERREFGNRWQHAGLTISYLGLALFYLPVMAITIFMGQRERPPSAKVKVELTADGLQALDERLTAFGMPSLVPPAAGRTLPPRPVARAEWPTATRAG
ncbi:Hypothetical protein ERS075612_04008 [Mycobacteroides abscessus]|uniref:hypothetical protein n=1 Tax=Mycobacteroides abscessus TaxID=36809 RepID=UPI0005E1A39B|nr:hypothetical protein [Mycobacteroides abscessus]CPR38234.1 Hypothetical protein ERS075588_03966 [Mycobacteroides abscessus]CPR75252.1 Hypothetical protein ERS075497_01948 [Mycobacteroides abscessus]CPS03388.1 Hypothetical protein ERS075498_04319 [Mycobacteroides abscessus]CPS53505.1 Hypothetical protein ERS075507_04108 [Mycobacteroides abscessus]CPS60027.1 Hypothetical protein ERS075509_04040 [Mycobacteroides abscessus]